MIHILMEYILWKKKKKLCPRVYMNRSWRTCSYSLWFKKREKLNSPIEKWQVYELSRAAVTNCHKLGGLKQQKFILLHFWRPEVQNVDVRQHWVLPKALKENLFCAPVLASGGVPWLIDTSLQSLPSSSRGVPSCLCISSFSVSYKDTCHWV